MNLWVKRSHKNKVKRDMFLSRVHKYRIDECVCVLFCSIGCDIALRMMHTTKTRKKVNRLWIMDMLGVNGKIFVSDLFGLQINSKF